MRHFASMQHLGIDVYAPRRVLVQARPSAFGLSRPELAEQPRSRARAEPQLPILEPPEDRKPSERPNNIVVSTSPTRRADSVRFQLLTVAFDSEVLFVSDLKTAPLKPALEATVLQFLRELMFALGRPASKSVAPLYFQWPLVDKPGPETSVMRAREVLAGFLDRCARETRPQHIVLLGEKAAELVEAEGEHWGVTEIPVWRSVALGKLFARPELKMDLWRTLKPLRINV